MRQTVLVIDDHEGFRESARLLPDLDGFEVAERLANLNHPPDVVLVSSRDAPDAR